MLIRRAGLVNVLSYTKAVIGSGIKDQATNVTSDMDRFTLLKGEISAGNDNKGIIKEFRSLLLKFINEKKIDREEGYRILNLL